MSRKDDILKLIVDYQIQLKRLENYALEGSKVRSTTIFEIEDIKTKVQNLQIELKAIEAAEDKSPQSIDSSVGTMEVKPKLARDIFISCERNIEPDSPLATYLYLALIEAGHNVSIGRIIKSKVEESSQIQRQIASCDLMLVLVSQTSAYSEMVAEEVKYAHQSYLKTGKSRLLPIRVNYTEVVPYQLSYYLDKLPYVEWHNQADNEWLVRRLLEAIDDIQSLSTPTSQPTLIPQEDILAIPQPYADPRFIESLREPSGAVHLQSEFYIEREEDKRLRQELAKTYGVTITIRAARQTGKSSLLIRGVAQAQRNGAKVVLIDLQPVEDHYLESLDHFLRYFVELIVTKLRLDPAEVEKSWHNSLGASDKASYLMESYVLSEVNTKVVLVIDEADRLLKTNFHNTFFGLLRYWHNSRARNETWENLSIVMALSTEPHLLISDVAQSPFNVGLRIHLDDFNDEQVRDLNRRYRSPLDEDDMPSFMDYLAGHPYLTRKALHTMVTQNLTWRELVPVIGTDASPVGDHLRRFLWLVSQQPELQQALKQVIQWRECPDETLYYRLFQAGLIKGATTKSVTCRCRLYEEYLKEHL